MAFLAMGPATCPIRGGGFAAERGGAEVGCL